MINASSARTSTSGKRYVNGDMRRLAKYHFDPGVSIGIDRDGGSIRIIYDYCSREIRRRPWCEVIRTCLPSYIMILLSGISYLAYWNVS